VVKPAIFQAAEEAGLLQPGQRLELVLTGGRRVRVTVAGATRTHLLTRPLIPGQRLRFAWAEIEEVHQRRA
jgi:hypothetical protein